MGWRHTSTLASRAIARHNMAPQVTAAAVCGAAERESHGHFVPISWKDGVLKLSFRTYDELIAVRQHEKEVIHRINTDVGEDAVTRITYSIA